MKFSKFKPVISPILGEGLNSAALTTADFAEINAELREKFLDSRIEDLERAFKITARLLNEPRWMSDIVLTEACRKYRTELLALKIELKALVVQKNEESKK